MVQESEQRAIWDMLETSELEWKYTDNIQKREYGLNRIIDELYREVKDVVTTRLHGAITAAEMGIPYIALARDEKIRAFNREYGGGTIVESIEEMGELIKHDKIL